jgi:hypothetical protein
VLEYIGSDPDVSVAVTKLLGEEPAKVLALMAMLDGTVTQVAMMSPTFSELALAVQIVEGRASAD